MSVTHYDGLSVYGSGIAYGEKPNEQIAITCSGNTTSALHIQPQSLDAILTAGGSTGIRIDAGSVGNSGWLKSAVSTRLSTVIAAFAMPVLPATGLAALASGFVSKVGAAVHTDAWCINLTMYADVSGGIGGVTSAGTSSQISYVVLGT